jgi:5-methylcytosine-specific restriction endonuclease McrA
MKDEFKAATLRQYGNMRTRFAPIYREDGVTLKRPGRKIPFSLLDYRNMMVFAMTTGLRCVYCNKRIRIDQVSPDHDVPVKRDGSLQLSNIVIACIDDNRAKGELTGDEYKAFLKGLATFPEPARKYIMKQMRQRPTFRPHPDAQTNKGSANLPKVRFAPASKRKNPSPKLFTTMEHPDSF